MPFEISASILSADFRILGEEIKSVIQSGVDSLHFDIMDGHFVPNLTFGPFMIKALRNMTDIHFAAHLMVENPELYLNECINYGANSIIVHAEAAKHLHRILQSIKQKGVLAGVAVNPSSPITFLPYVRDVVDEILIMTVNPGFAAQSLIESVLPKIREARVFKENLKRPFKISVDGGVNEKTITSVVGNGADNIITASALFGAKDRGEFIKGLRAASS